MRENTFGSTKFVKSAVCVLFVISGFTGLVYEVVWVRMFTTVFGNTVFATSTVLTAFMGGLALGSYLIGRTADRSEKSIHALRLYAGLEIGVGISALLIFVALMILDTIHTWFFRNVSTNFWSLTTLRFILSISALIIPTALMGGTLPALSKYIVQLREKIGGNVGLLYSLNTFGAVLGCFLTGFLLIATLGLHLTIYLAAVANIIVGVVAFLFSRNKQFKDFVSQIDSKQSHVALSHPQTPSIEQSIPSYTRVVLIVFGLSGFAALAYEVLWSRLLVYIFSTTTYAFSIMLTTFLFGIALGSMISSKFVDRYPGKLPHVFAIFEFLLGVYGITSIFLLSNFAEIHDFVLSVIPLTSWWMRNAVRFTEAFLIMFFPTLIMGAVFPVVSKIYANSLDRLGRKVGNIYSTNTLGGIIGSFAAGFILIPLIGISKSILFAASFNLIGFILLLSTSPESQSSLWLQGKSWLSVKIAGASLAGVIIVVSFVGVPSDILLDFFNVNEEGSEIIYSRKSVAGTLTVHKYPRAKVLAIDGVNVAGTLFDLRTTQKLQGLIPVMVHGNAQKILQIGFGSGETTHVALLNPVEEMVLVEIASTVLDSAHYFSDINEDVLEDDRLTPVVMDGKNYVKSTDQTYDVIMNDSIYPTLAGGASLYTQDHFAESRRKLTDDGVFSCWIPLDLKTEQLKMVMATFHSVFPHSMVWLATNCMNKHALLVGCKSEFSIDFERLKARLNEPEIRASLEEVGLANPFLLIDCLLIDEHGMAEFVRGAKITTDDKPLLEFYAPRRPSLGTDDRIWAYNLELLAHLRSDKYDFLKNITEAEREKMQLYFDATTHRILGQISDLRMESGRSVAEYKRALEINPDDTNSKRLLSKIEQKREAYIKATKKAPKDVKIQFDLAMRYWIEKDYVNAKRQLQKVIELQPNHVEAHTNLGNVYRRLEKISKAKAEYEKALSLQPKNAEAHYNLGKIYENERKIQAAKESYKKVIKWGEEYALSEARVNLGNIFRKEEKIDRALNEYKKAIEANPNNAAAYFNLGNLYLNQGKKEMAIQTHLKAIKAEPDFYMSYSNLGVIYDSQKRFKDAEKAYKKSLEIKYDQPQTHYLLGINYARRNKFKLAQSEFETSLDQNPNFTPAKTAIQKLESITN